MNPSTATASTNDPTIRKCVSYAKTWGHGSLLVLNIFAWRSTDPSVLKDVEDPIGPDNDAAIMNGVRGAGVVLCAWGKYGGLRGRGSEVLSSLRAAGVTPRALSLNNDGSPAHPLYLPSAFTPQVMR